MIKWRYHQDSENSCVAKRDIQNFSVPLLQSPIYSDLVLPYVIFLFIFVLPCRIYKQNKITQLFQYSWKEMGLETDGSPQNVQWLLTSSLVKAPAETTVLGSVGLGRGGGWEESYRMCGVSECDREASTMKRPWPTRDCRAMKKKLEPRCTTF